MTLHHIPPLSLFRQGMDTQEIAAFLGCSEAVAYNQISQERQAEKYEARHEIARGQTYRRDLIRYAGAE